ncbi:protein trichome birefringence-like 19 [Andrographis paniculata]|uniref:protein trichome birefringence-like 19 n=1 Tax=Andrographis paniculata TaxID=175694 RepID=UPI0021E7CCAA|nr:protein trichome birefringence-like 19 [Andrographis paniculata]
MKQLQDSEVPKRDSKLVVQIIALIFVLTVIPLYFPSTHKKLLLAFNIIAPSSKCDLFAGEWVPNPEAPYYTNFTCHVIQEQQNCMKFGRPDTDFQKWRWKPDACDLPIFDPYDFLDIMSGKSMAFVGDSVARNHMQSLICLLSRVVHPVNITRQTDDYNRYYVYPDYNFSVSFFSSQYLVRAERTDPGDISRPFNLFLDEFDESWTAGIASFDYVVISAGAWFFRPTYFYLNKTLAGCLYCPEPNVTHRPLYFSYRWAFRTAFRAIRAAGGFEGTVFLRTFSPTHFEGGAWDNGGDCVRTRPFRRNETALEYYTLKMYNIQVEEMKTAQDAGKSAGGIFRLLDATRPMLLRPDGHPGKYGRWAVVNQTFSNDCVHWCLPGPIDAWNDFLLHLLKEN